MRIFDHKSHWIYEGRVFDAQCCCLCIFVGRGSCVLYTMLLSLYVCLLREDCVFDPQYCRLCIFVERAYWIYEGSLFHPRFSLSLWGQRSNEYIKFMCSIHTPLSLSIFVGSCVSLYLCWESCFISLLGERQTGSTSNQVEGKEAISVNSNYLNILHPFKLS